jgi:hypothetical protein
MAVETAVRFSERGAATARVVAAVVEFGPALDLCVCTGSSVSTKPRTVQGRQPGRQPMPLHVPSRMRLQPRGRAMKRATLARRGSVKEPITLKTRDVRRPEGPAIGRTTAAGPCR